MLWILFLLPLLFVVYLAIFFRSKVTPWEYVILVVPSVLLTVLIYFGMVSYSKSDTEYLGDYVTEIRYYEPWNEYIHRTCTRTSRVGNSTVTTTYDCSYVQHHSEKFVQVYSGYEYEITKIEFERLSKLWSKNSLNFKDMNRHFHTKDGDMYFKKYDYLREHIKTRTVTNTYSNKIKASHSIFGFIDISKEDAKKMGLHDYPELYKQKGGAFFENDQNQNPFIGYTPRKEELDRWQFLNGYYGNKKQIRLFLLFYYNKPQSIVQDQRSYWEGGNKNEMVLCFGIDSITKKIQWADAFSWCDRPTFEVNFRSYMSGKDKLNLIELSKWSEHAINNYWVRKNFKDFDYIDVELTNTQLMWLLGLILLFNAAMSFWIVINDKEN